ncbi:hypothetical protein [Deinococcus petrolearius]|uniref:Lipoprotein n=1 Tax=Deinococcus petrolearius TaxID=1751295 RepID=A0ABW1DNP9_9DEIO
MSLAAFLARRMHDVPDKVKAEDKTLYQVKALNRAIRGPPCQQTPTPPPPSANPRRLALAALATVLALTACAEKNQERTFGQIKVFVNGEPRVYTLQGVGAGCANLLMKFNGPSEIQLTLPSGRVVQARTAGDDRKPRPTPAQLRLCGTRYRVRTG